MHIYGWFHLATAKIYWDWWKLEYCNNCNLLPCKSNILKFFLYIIWVCKHLDFKFVPKPKKIQKCLKFPIFLGITPVFEIFKHIWNFLFALKSWCLHIKTICITNFKNFDWQGEKWQRLQYCNFPQWQHIFAVANYSCAPMFPFNGQKLFAVNGWCVHTELQKVGILVSRIPDIFK